MFSKISNYPIGLDISDLSLKFVQLNKIKDVITIQSFSKISLQKDCIESGEIKDKAKVLKAIKTLMNKPKFGKVTSNQVIACLPEPKTFIKLIEVEGDPDDLEDAVISELKKHIPLSIDEIYYDYQVIESSEDEKLVIFGASPKNLVDQYLDLLTEAKLSVLALEIESTAISRSLLLEESPDYSSHKSRNYVIVDIGANRSSVFVYSKNTVLFNVSIPISGRDISDKIAETLKIKSEKADIAKIVCGLDKKKCGGVINNNLSYMIEKLVDRIEDVIQFYYNHFSEYGKLNKILLCGGVANIKNIDKTIEKKTSIKTKVGNAFTNLTKPNGVSVNLSKPSEVFVKNFIETYKLNIDSIQNKGKKTGHLSVNKVCKKSLSIKQDSSITYVTAIGLGLRGIFMD